MFLQHPLAHIRIHGFYGGELARSCCSRASPNHNTSTSMLHSWYEVLFLECRTVFGSCQKCLLFWCPNNSILDSSVLGTLFQELWSLCSLWKTSVWPFMFFFVCFVLMKIKLVWSLSDSWDPAVGHVMVF